MAYLYRHIRLDKNTPFYIGIGVDSNGDYRRAYSKANRNKYWNNVVNKTQYEIEIIIDGITWDMACKKEVEFIKIYGRKDLGNGILVNMSEGGEGVTSLSKEAMDRRIASRKKNYIVSDETKRKLSESHKGYKPTEETRRKLSIKSKQNIISKETREKMASKLRGRPQPQWQRDILSKAAIGKKVAWCHKPIVQFTLDGHYVKDFESIAAASRELKIHHANILKVIHNKRTHTGGFSFKYK